MADNRVICAVGISICVAITLLIVLLVSIGTVEPIEYGIIYNSLTKSVDSKTVYPGGWYLIGPINSFITFPATLVNLDFADFDGAANRPLVVKDNDGQEIRLSFSIQYKLQEKQIGELYLKLQKGYETTFYTYVDSVVRKVVGDFDSTMFWNNRTLAGELLRADIDKKLKIVYTDVNFLQILNVQLADKREQSLIATQVTQQQGKTKRMEQQAKQTRSEITVLASQSEKQITEIKGNAVALTKTIAASASAKAATMTIKATTDAYLELKSNVGIDPQNSLDRFIYYTELQTAENPVFLYDVDRAIIRLT